MQFGKGCELYSQSLWQLFAEAGLLGTAVPEAHDGTGFGFIEICQILEEQGRFVARRFLCCPAWYWAACHWRVLAAKHNKRNTCLHSPAVKPF